MQRDLDDAILAALRGEPDTADAPAGEDRDYVNFARRVARATEVENPMVEPLDPATRESIWAAIAAEVGREPIASSTPTEPTLTEPTLTDPTLAEPTPLISRRARSARPLVWLAAAAALAAVVAVAATLARSEDEPTPIAAARLDVLSAPAGTSGAAELIDDDGQLRIELQLDAPQPDGYYEVWMIDTDVTKLVSLGPSRADGVYDLPAGLNPKEYPVVDVSLEHFDGDPTHSGESILRGKLKAD